MTDDEIRVLIRKARVKIHEQNGGTLHGMWDVLFDIESHLKGGSTIAPYDKCLEHLINFTK